jgi:hypothetical protein
MTHFASKQEAWERNIFVGFVQDLYGYTQRR